MNASEFMAMLDDRLSDGRRYPTLDEYAEALRNINAPTISGHQASIATDAESYRPRAWDIYSCTWLP